MLATIGQHQRQVMVEKRRISLLRVVAPEALVLFFWLTVAIYLAATLLIKEKPLVYSGRRTEYDFWRTYRRDHWRRS